MEMSKELLDMINADICEIENMNQRSFPELMRLHRKLDGRYQACIQDWRKSLWGADYEGTNIAYHLLEDEPEEVKDNLEMMKAKLEAFRFQMNAVAMPELPTTQVNVTTNVNVTISFDEVRKKIEENGSLSQEQTDEAISKINELEEISKSNISRKSKWEKVKPIIAFAMDKGADLGIAILTLIVQMKLGM